MGLVERLMKWEEPEPYEGYYMPVHHWYGIMGQLARGQITRQAVIDYFQMSAADITDFDNLIARYQTKTNDAQRALFISGVHEIFILSGQPGARFPGYDTPALVRALIAGL